MADRIITLDNNFEVLYEDGLDGGGYDHLSDFVDAVKIGGRNNYERGVEWCAGFGVIGFDFLNRKVCNHMSFIDCYDLAIDWLTKTSIHNNVNNQTSFYVADKISMISDEVKWDLVLANPPHCFTKGEKENFEHSLSGQQKEDVIRIVCDEGFVVHTEFFRNIRIHLLPGADIFISEVTDLDVIERLASDAGLELANRYPAPKLSIDSRSNAQILHFKEPL